MTHSDFLKLTPAEQTKNLEKLISKLSFKRKDPLISAIGYLRLVVDDFHNNTSWNVYRFDLTIEELTSKFERLNNLRKGV